MYFGTQPYGLEGHIEHHGSASNMYRGETFGQPRTLGPGDVLANGLEVAEPWSEAGNGGIGLCFTDGQKRVVAARIPLLLEGGTKGKLPLDLEVGDIFETGCVVLSEPSEIDSNDLQYVAGREEALITITGGLSGHTIALPKDVHIALHGETYPPSLESRFGAFVIDNTLKMGAMARRNLPQYGRLDNQPEAARVADIFSAISTLRATAQSEMAAYERTLAELKEQADQLKGVELRITGRLRGRGGTRVYDDNPDSWVENMHVEVARANVHRGEGYGDRVMRYQPIIEFYGHTIEGDELVSAWTGAGEFGVTVEDPNAHSEQEQ